MASRFDRLRASTRPARRWLASWLLAPLTTRRWVAVLVVLAALIGGCVLSGCATNYQSVTDREFVRAEAARLRSQYGDPSNWPADEWARWERMVREVTP